MAASRPKYPLASWDTSAQSRPPWLPSLALQVPRQRSPPARKDEEVCRRAVAPGPRASAATPKRRCNRNFGRPRHLVMLEHPQCRRLSSLSWPLCTTLCQKTSCDHRTQPAAPQVALQIWPSRPSKPATPKRRRARKPWSEQAPCARGAFAGTLWR